MSNKNRNFIFAIRSHCATQRRTRTKKEGKGKANRREINTFSALKQIRKTPFGGWGCASTVQNLRMVRFKEHHYNIVVRSITTIFQMNPRTHTPSSPWYPSVVPPSRSIQLERLQRKHSKTERSKLRFWIPKRHMKVNRDEMNMNIDSNVMWRRCAWNRSHTHTHRDTFPSLYSVHTVIQTYGFVSSMGWTTDIAVHNAHMRSTDLVRCIKTLTNERWFECMPAIQPTFTVKIINKHYEAANTTRTAMWRSWAQTERDKDWVCREKDGGKKSKFYGFRLKYAYHVCEWVFVFGCCWYIWQHYSTSLFGDTTVNICEKKHNSRKDMLSPHQFRNVRICVACVCVLSPLQTVHMLEWTEHTNASIELNAMAIQKWFR